MMDLIDDRFNNTSLMEKALSALQAVRSDFPVDDVRNQLIILVEEARRLIPESMQQDIQLEKLLTIFYDHWGFGGANESHHFSDTLWIDQILKTRQGAPVSLGIIFLYIADQLEIPVLPVLYPTQLILRAEWLDEELWLIDPLTGETLDEHTLDAWLKGHFGFMYSLEMSDLDESDNDSVVRKLISSLKGALLQEDRPELALKASEFILAYDPEDPYERRDRGLIYAQLDCNHVAISDLNYFLSQCPEDPVADMIRVQLHGIEQDIVLH